MNRAAHKRLNRVAQRLGPRRILTKAEARELAALETEHDCVPLFELMSGAELDQWFRTWGCGNKGARLGELRQRARTPDERRSDEEQAVMFAAMSTADLDDWLIAYMRKDLVGLEGEELANAEDVVSANEAYLARIRVP